MFGFNNGGIDAMVISSTTAADLLIEHFGIKIKQGFDPNDVCDEVFKEVGVTSNDLTPIDYNYVQRTVERIWREYYQC